MSTLDVPDWKSYEDFAAGIDTNRLPATDALSGTELVVSLDGGTRLSYRFDGASSLVWSLTGGDRPGSGSGWYEAIDVGDSTFFVDATFDERPREALTLIADTHTCAALAIACALDEEKQPWKPRVRQMFTPGVVGDPGTAATVAPPAPTRDLVGRRALHRYSGNHLYEHVYLSSGRYCWQCLEGVERGLADVDAATTYRFDEDRYLLAFREYVLDVASVLFLDLRAMRSTGKFFGLTEAGEIENAPTGAHITMIGPAAYPDGVEPS